MAHKLIFKTSFLISGIMCFQGCGATIQDCFLACLLACKNEKILPSDAELILDAEPQALGIHHIFISIENKDSEVYLSTDLEERILARFKNALASFPHFKIIEPDETPEKNTSKNLNWYHIALNLFSGSLIIILSLVFPPSVLLSIGLTACSFLTTAFTARTYLSTFFRNIGSRTQWTEMSSTVSLGWILSLIHALYHTITMPLISSFSMIFMCFIMPVLLITVINGMDELKQHILNQSKKMYLQGTRLLFPEMAEHYSYYALSHEEQQRLSLAESDNLLLLIEQIIKNKSVLTERKNALKQGMIILVKKGDCFPVDCLLIKEDALVDSSLLTGEPQQMKQKGDFIPAGAINLSQSVSVYATKDSYSSTINQILFCSNRASEHQKTPKKPLFIYLYSALILLGIASSIIAPMVLGIATLPLLLQNIIGILFAICPCTLAIAQELPALINQYRRAQKGILVRDAHLCTQIHEPHTVIFDKTGTLTTGRSQVHSFDEDISPELWKKIYLLEKNYGAEHPIAKAIIHYYETQSKCESLFEQDIKEVVSETNSRGLSGMVQGKEIHIGNAAYLQKSGINVPKSLPIDQAFTAVYVAENKHFKGIIYIKHQIRKDVLKDISLLKKQGKKIILLTGDSTLAALSFNQQNGALFDPKNIHAKQTPQAKEQFIDKLMSSQGLNPQGVWFIGDGLNDAPCAKMVSEKGGISFAISKEDKTSFFSNISLNGSLQYLLEHNKLNAFFQKNVLQNQALLIYGSLAFIAFIISFSLAGIALTPIIPLMIMASTTLIIVFNSYRVQLNIDTTLDPKISWLKQFLASDVSIGLLAGSSLLFLSSLLISTLITGGLALPVIVFTAGMATALSSLCLLSAGSLFGLFAVLGVAYLIGISSPKEPVADLALVSSVKTVEEKKPVLEGHDSSISYPFWKSTAEEVQSTPEQTASFRLLSSYP